MEINNPKVWNFQGYPILQFASNFELNDEEAQFINELEFRENVSNFMTKEFFILNDKKFKRIKDMFNHGMEYYTKKVLEISDALQMENSWITLNKRFQNHHDHDHQNVLFSMCYYPQIEDGAFCVTFQRSILQQGYNFSYTIINPNEYNGNRHQIPIKAGDCIIFPAWLFHSSTPNTSEVERYMIGANYFLRGTLGSEIIGDLLTI